MTVHLYPNKQKQFLKTVKTAPNQQKRDFHSTKQRFYYHNLIDSVLIKCRILTNIYVSTTQVSSKRVKVYLHYHKQTHLKKKFVKIAQNERKRELHETKKRFYYYNLTDSVSIKNRILTKNVF